MRREREKRLDAVLLLYILRKSGPSSSRTRVQKTTFLVEFNLRRDNLVGPHFRFFRYLKGPYSQQITQDLDELARNGFISRTTLTPTERGQFLIDLVIPTL